ncbi:hypothetical protein CY34DRAFT_133586 [Suillus luteus UH-Slu-Lm8-n1]|uniref:Uncharacterized protein n=1 Tax=Suillus luteus UH-Slu-Lm8-n1 TaxID=930992 RepID=A0A0C9Z5I1_9AGAM|nr:hypothetical protein CY34DRAFT_133586 [Suillus luteus UH-Slu-Lm8-n1]
MPISPLLCPFPSTKPRRFHNKGTCHVPLLKKWHSSTIAWHSFKYFGVLQDFCDDITGSDKRVARKIMILRVCAHA